MLVVQRLAGVLLQMQPLDADREALAVRQIDHDLALAHDRRLVLADLIALRQIGIEIVLPVEHRLQVDLRLKAEAGAHRLAHAFLVDHRQHARHRRIDQRDVAFGAPPNSVEAPENSLALEVTWAWTSMPITTSSRP